MRLLTIALGLPLLFCTACSPPGDHGLADRLASQVAAGDGTVVDVKQLSPFRWSRFHVFCPYTTEESAERTLGFEWPYSWGPVEHLDDRFLLVFVDSGRVVSAFEQSYAQGYWAEACGNSGYAPDSARFMVRREGNLLGGAPQHVLYPIR